MADIFQEVDEEVRRERLKQLWERHGYLIIAIVVLVVVGVGGWRGYQWWEGKKAAEAGAAFESAITLSEAGKHSEAEAAFAKIATEAPGGYRVLARLRAASELALTDAKAGVAAYDKIAADTSLSEPLRDVAALRAGMLLVDTAPFSELRARLDPLAEPGRPFRHSAREMLVLSAWRGGDTVAAKRYIDLITNDPDTPQGTRSRVDVISALIGANGKS